MKPGGKGQLNLCSCVGGNQVQTSWQEVGRCCLCDSLQNLLATLRFNSYNSLKINSGKWKRSNLIWGKKKKSLKWLKHVRVFSHRRNKGNYFRTCGDLLLQSRLTCKNLDAHTYSFVWWTHHSQYFLNTEASKALARHFRKMRRAEGTPPEKFKYTFIYAFCFFEDFPAISS